jgi:hypothetical protein
LLARAAALQDDTAVFERLGEIAHQNPGSWAALVVPGGPFLNSGLARVLPRLLAVHRGAAALDAAELQHLDLGRHHASPLADGRSWRSEARAAAAPARVPASCFPSRRRATAAARRAQALPAEPMRAPAPVEDQTGAASWRTGAGRI